MEIKEARLDRGIITWFIICHAIGLIGPFFFFSWGAVLTAIALYFITVLGITLGYHRLMTHRAFKTSRGMERFLASIGMLALQRSPVEWVGHHRMHHAFSDTDKDPHDASKGFWFSHIGWMCTERPFINDMKVIRRYARDISADPYLDWMTGHWVQIGFQVALGVALWIIGGTDYMVWGVFTRLVAVYHATWLVNSATHKWGYQNYKCDDLSSNTWWVGLLALGEGWHNNHHALPDVAPAGRRWWEFDFTWQVIKMMKFFGLVHSVKMPLDLKVVGSHRTQPIASKLDSVDFA